VRVDAVREAGRPPLPDSFPLSFAFTREAGRLGLELQHHTARHTAEGARLLLGQCSALLERATADPDAALAALDLRTAADVELARRANDTRAEFEDTARLDQLLSRQAMLTPDAVAVVGDTFRLTYAELEARANRLARHLRDRGVGREDIVAVLADRSPEMLVAVYAVLKAGGAYLPVDPGHPPERIGYVLRDSGARLALVQPWHAPLVTDGIGTVELTDDASSAYPSDPPALLGDARDLAYVIYTSGSTGRPKGVEVEHRSVVNRIAWMQKAYPIGAADVLLQKTSVSFDVSVWELFWWMLTGASVCLPPAGAERDPEALAGAVERHGVTTLHFVPSMLGVFLDFAVTPAARSRLGSLRQVFASGEALAPRQARRFAEVLDGARLVNLYGPTEATVDVTHHLCDAAAERVPIGHAIDNTRVHVLDTGLRPQPTGVPGELCLAGTALARGYRHRPELTAERFVAAPAAGEERVYRTGDLGRRLPDGAIEYLGRIDHQVKLRGYRIELGEIEERLREHTAVADCVVVLRAGRNEQAYLCGYTLSAQDTGPVSEDELRRHLGRTLPEYMVPARLVALDAFPLTSSGKLDRRALPDPARSAEYVAPRTPPEEALAGIWREVLGRGPIGVHDNFFALGGNSIHFVTVLAKARAACLDFTFQQLFAHPTVAGLAAAIESPANGAAEAGAADPAPEPRPFELLTPEDRAAVPPGVEDAYPLTHLQAGLVFQSELSEGTAEYHDILSYLIQSPFDAGSFEAAVRILVARNPVFRTSYQLTGYSEYLQFVHVDAPVPLDVEDLRGMTGQEQDAWYGAWVEREKARRFVWAEPGLVRLHVQMLSDDLFRYTLTQHNSALDGWSITLVHTQLFDLYHRLRDGRPLPGGAVRNHGRDYALLERRSLADQEHRDHWAGLLDGSVFTAVPRTLQSGPVGLFRVVFHEVEFPRGLSDRVVALAERLSVPVKNVAMAAHVKVLSVVAGESDVLTGYEQSGRPEAEDATRAIGLFLNTVPLRVSVEPGRWQDLIARIYRAETELLPARRYPMARMKQDLGTQRQLFETAFNFTHFYLLKELASHDGFTLLDIRANSETEFPLRAEFSRHFVTDELRLSLHYHAHLFEPWQIERIGAYYAAAFEQMTADPTDPHHLAVLLPSEESAALAAAELAEPLLPALARLLPVPGGRHRARVVDDHGLRAPFATPGRIMLTGGETGDEQVETPYYGRRTPDGLEVLGRLDERPRPVFRRSGGRPAPAPAARGLTGRPADSVRARIAEVWGQVLDVPAAWLTPEADFFALGGNSLTAMRAVLALDGLVRLVDMMRHPTLEALSAAARAGMPESEPGAAALEVNLLHLLSAEPDRARGALVCFPYAAGNAINYQPLAAEITKLGGDLAVYGVELPGHDAGRRDEPFASLEDTARRVAAEIRHTVDGPVMLWGHCVGSALAVETARLLEATGEGPLHVFTAGKLLQSAEATRRSLAVADRMADAEIVAWLSREVGLTGLDGLGAEPVAFVARMFRHDSGTANTYLLEAAAQEKDRRLSTPLTAVYASDDVLTPDHARGYAAWSAVTAELHWVDIGPGGHYFCRTAPHAVADLVLRTWRAARDGGS
jgi:amino acid adenylation domain-containing protein